MGKSSECVSAKRRGDSEWDLLRRVMIRGMEDGGGSNGVGVMCFVFVEKKGPILFP